jgi:hypothetical protein
VRGQTIQRVATPTAILVGLPEPLASWVADVLADGGLKVLKVGHVAAACERLPVVMPQLVVVPAALAQADRETIEDRCVAVGAQLKAIDVEAQPTMHLAMLKDAANEALIRALRRGS